MARRIASRIKVSGTLVAQSPVHVGGIGGNPEVDLALAVNGQGQYYIPGTSLAGAFRSWMQMSESVDNLWGFQEKNGRGGYASFVIVEDAPIVGVDVEIRDGVGIDRVWGAAAEQVKYDRAILPRGAKIPLHLILEVASESEEWRTAKTLFAGLLKSLEDGEIRIGAAKTRGLGRVKLQNISIRESNLCCRDGMLKALRGNDSKITLDSLVNDNQDPSQNSRLTFVINWEPQGSLMVKAEGNGIAVDILPLISAVDNSLTFVLPGSSIKGALRFQAERIVRTVRSLQPSTELDTKKRFMKQLDIPLVRDLFGATAKTEKKTQLGKIGSLFVDDCYANLPINPAAWGNIEAATNENNLREALNNAKLQNTQQAFHVAVDRWTGGAADGMLYSTLELMGITWQPIRLTLDLPRLKEQDLPRLKEQHLQGKTFESSESVNYTSQSDMTQNTVTTPTSGDSSATKPLGEFHNPYNFVPALPRNTESVQNSELGDRSPCCHGSYLNNYWSGRISVTLTTITPLLIPDAAKARELEGTNGHKIYPIRLVNGKPYLPPTSVKGMLRSAYEVVTNSRLSVFEKKHENRLAYRMPTNLGLQMVPARIEDNDNGQKIIRLLPGTSSISSNGSPNPNLMYAAWLPRYSRGQISRNAAKYPNGKLPEHREQVEAWVEKIQHWRWDKKKNQHIPDFQYWCIRKIVPVGETLRSEPDSARKTDKTEGFSHHEPLADFKKIRGFVCITNPNIDRKHDERVFFDSATMA